MTFVIDAEIYGCNKKEKEEGKGRKEGLLTSCLDAFALTENSPEGAQSSILSGTPRHVLQALPSRRHEPLPSLSVTWFALNSVSSSCLDRSSLLMWRWRKKEDVYTMSQPHGRVLFVFL